MSDEKIELHSICKYGVKQTVDDFGLTQFRPTSKQSHYAPAIINEFSNEDNVRMYECEGGRFFFADMYDKAFIPDENANTEAQRLLKLSMRTRNYKVHL